MKPTIKTACALLSLTCAFSSAYAGKEGGNQLLLPNGDTAYRSETCTVDTPVSKFIERNGLSAQYGKILNTAKKFQPGVGKAIAKQEERVCVTKRPVGSLVGLGDSELRVMGYAPGIRYNSPVYSHMYKQAPYIFISQDFLGKASKEGGKRKLAEMLFAESLHPFIQNKSYTRELFAIEGAMKALIDYSEAELNTENLRDFNKELSEAGFPDISKISVNPQSIEEMNKYIELAGDYANLNVGNENLSEEIPLLDDFFNPKKEQEVAKFIRLVTSKNIRIDLSKAATAKFVNFYVDSSYAHEELSAYPELLPQPQDMDFYPARNLDFLDEMQKSHDWAGQLNFAPEFFSSSVPFTAESFGQITYSPKNTGNIVKMVKNGILNPNRITEGYYLSVKPHTVAEALLIAPQVKIANAYMKGYRPQKADLALEMFVKEQLFSGKPTKNWNRFL